MTSPSTSRAVTLAFDEFARTSLEEQVKRDGLSTSDLVRMAASYYLADLPAERLARRLPRFVVHAAPVRPLEVRFELAVRDWDALEQEAIRQAVPLARLLEHAVLYYLADLASGRVAARIVENSTS
jgi:hypothetical protein